MIFPDLCHLWSGSHYCLIEFPANTWPTVILPQSILKRDGTTRARGVASGLAQRYADPSESRSKPEPHGPIPRIGRGSFVRGTYLHMFFKNSLETLGHRKVPQICLCVRGGCGPFTLRRLRAELSNPLASTCSSSHAVSFGFGVLADEESLNMTTKHLNTHNLHVQNQLSIETCLSLAMKTNYFDENYPRSGNKRHMRQQERDFTVRGR